MSDRIEWTVDRQVARVRLNRPDKRNALDLEMFRAIDAVQKSLADLRDLRAVVLSGAGLDFCSGLDVKAAMHDRRGMVRLLWKWLPWRANLAQRAGLGWRELRAADCRSRLARIFGSPRPMPPCRSWKANGA